MGYVRIAAPSASRFQPQLFQMPPAISNNVGRSCTVGPGRTTSGQDHRDGSAETRSIDLSSCAPPNSVPSGWHEPLWSAVDGRRDIVRRRRARRSCAETMHCSGRVLWGHLGGHRCLWGHLGGHGYHLGGHGCHLGGHGCHRGGHGCRPVCTAIEP